MGAIAEMPGTVNAKMERTSVLYRTNIQMVKPIEKQSWAETKFYMKIHNATSAGGWGTMQINVQTHNPSNNDSSDMPSHDLVRQLRKVGSF